MLPAIFFSVVLFLLGSAIGSFANVVIYRVPRGLSVVKPRSFCPGCDTPIEWYDNIPLLSWLLLRGRCRRCGCRISPVYLLVEFTNAAMYVAVFAHFGFGWDAFLPLYLFFVTVTLMVGMIDLKELIIPNAIILPSLLIAVVYVGVIALVRWDSQVLVEQGAGLLIGGGPLGLISLLYPKGMGMGDAKLMAFSGVVLGWDVIPALFLGFLLGSIASIPPILTGKKEWKSKIPFGPYLIAGSWISIFVGGWIIELYRSMMR